MIVPLAIVTLGCDSSDLELVPVSGLVTLDGKAVAGAAIVFTPQKGGRPAWGTTDEQGEFHLTTLEENDGAIVGTHVATVSLREATPMIPTPDGLDAYPDPNARIDNIWIVPRRYANNKTSPLEVDVYSGMEVVRLDISTDTH